MRDLLSPCSSWRDGAGVCSGDKHRAEGNSPAEPPRCAHGHGAQQGWPPGAKTSCFPQVERGTESRSLEKVKYPSSFLSGEGGTVPLPV